MKRFISIVLTVMILMSICVTGTAMEASAATATVNGKTFNVGDTIKYTVNVQFDKALEDFEANVFYSEEGLSLKVKDSTATDPKKKYDATFFETKGVAIFNPVNTTIYPGRSTVSYNGVSPMDLYDYTTKHKLVEVYFVVEKAGNWTIENKFEVATAGSDGSKYANGGEVKKPFTNEQIVELAEAAPTPSSSQVSQKATVNGKTFNVGDTVTYTLSAQFPKVLEEFEGDIFYSEEGLSLKVKDSSVPIDQPWNGRYDATFYLRQGLWQFNPANTTIYPGRSVTTYIASSPMDPYDLRSTTKLLEINFVVTKAGTWTIDNKFSTVTATDSTKYVYKSEVINPFKEVEEVTGSTPSTSATVPTTSSSSKITSSSTAPTTSSSSSAQTSSSYTPVPGKTTFNGIECKVGDTATYYVYAQADKPIGSIQYEVDYGNQVTGNIDGLKLMDWSYVTLDTNTIVNPNIPGNFIYTVATSTNSYDFTKKTEMLKVNFKIEKEGTYFANGRWVTFVSDMDYPYIDGGYLFDNNYCKDTKTVINAQQPQTSSSSQTTPPPTSSSTAKPQPKTYTITKNLTNVTSTNGAATIKENEIYTTILAPAKGYEISSVTVTVGSQAYTPTKNADGTYTISVKATGNISINAYAKAEETSAVTTPVPAEYAVVVNAINAKSSNTATTVKAGTTYMTVIAPDSGYEISTIVASVGGQTINPIKNADGTYTVTTVASGDIIINAVATKKDPISETYTITNSLTNVVSSNTQTTIKKGETYNTTLVPQEGYTIQSVVVTVGSTQITPVKNGNMYIITAPATGNIVVVAVATKNATIPTSSETSSSSSSETSSSSSEISSEPTSETIPPTSSGQVITINKMILNNTNLVVSEGTNVDLIASIWPGYTTQKTVTWSVTNSRVGVCSQTKSTKTGLYDNDGKMFCTETATFTAKDDGQTVVKAVSDTGLVAKCVITVKPLATSIKINPTSKTLYNGQSTTLKATVGPSNIASNYKKVSWSTSNKKVATVTSKGKVVARGRGTCVITARSADNTALTAKCKITVKQRVTSIKFSKSSVTLAKKNKSATVKVYAYPSNANNKSMTVKSENTRIAKVNRKTMNSGQPLKITAVKKGTAYVRATAKDGSKKYARCKVVVKK